MIVLAIDTALENCSVAISDGHQVWTSEREIGRGHAEILMPALAALMAESGLTVAQLGRIAVSTGPGSFTGIRVGVAAARGLALVGDIPVVGVSTLQANACLAVRLAREAGRPARSVLSLLPARGEDLYGQLFSADGDALDTLAVATVADFAARARAGSYDVAGGGAGLLGEDFEPLHLRSAPPIDVILELGGRLDPKLHPAVPDYGKPPDAAPQNGAIARR